MRPNNQNGKRSRGRTRRPSGFNQPNVNRNTTFESNGPEGKLRGNAQQLFEKYTALAQDANSSSERISAEAFSQFADHYYRVHQTILAAMEQKRNIHENKNEAKSKNSEEVASIENGANEDKETETETVTNSDTKNKTDKRTEIVNNSVVKDTENTGDLAQSSANPESTDTVSQEAGDAVA